MECDVKPHTPPHVVQCNDEKSVNGMDESPAPQGPEAYTQIRILGKGGSALVYLVRSKHSGKFYAMKKIALDESRPSRRKENVLKEAVLLSRLRHPHIVTCRSFFFDNNLFDENLSIIQDYCDDGTIFDKISEAKKNNIKFEESLVLRWFVQIAMAVQYIHSQKILHRDIKSQNVFLTRGGIAKLGDFGIARVMESTVDLAQTCIGTPCYLSPEVCQDLPYSTKADMWSMGCLLYEMLMLQYPFDANNIVTLYYKIVKCDYKDVTATYSQEIRSVISQMLSKSSDDRPTISAVMNNTFIQAHLEAFLADCELKQEQFSKNKIVHEQKRAKLLDIVSPPLPKEEADESVLRSRKAAPAMSSKDTGIYADDFIEEDDSDYSDDFEDEDDDDNDEDDVDNEDFTSDEENKFTSVVANARDEVQKERIEKSDENFAETIDEDDDDWEEFGIHRNFFKRHCKDLMGSIMFNQVVDICRGGKDKDFSSLKSEFEDVAGKELLDSCFLVNELVMREKNN